ncbi:MAG: hypothetical protein QHJ73_15045, partial [Armatimonadota bacterium]|nr:hypothetical protein [Armatimonadota bacterium]
MHRPPQPLYRPHLAAPVPYAPMRPAVPRPPRPSYPLAVLYALTIGGFPLVSILPLMFETGSRTFTLPYRIVVVLGCLVFLFVSVLRRRRFYTGPIFWAAMLQWTFLFLSMARSVWFTEVMPIQTAREWTLRAIGIAYIPALVAFQRPTVATLRLAAHFAFWLALVGTVAVAYFAIWVNPAFLYVGRIGTDVLDPISFGHLCLSLLIIAVWGFPEAPVS